MGAFGVVDWPCAPRGRDRGSFTSTIGLTFGLDPLSGFFLAVLALTGGPDSRIGPRLSAREQRRQGPWSAHRHVPAVAGGGARGSRRGQLPRLLGADDTAPRGRDTPRAPRCLRALRRVRVSRDHASGGSGIDRPARAREPRSDRRSVGARRCRSGAQTLLAVAALIGFGTKAGSSPCTPAPAGASRAPAHLSALMSGMMVKVAIYGLIRVEFQWLGATPRGWGWHCSPSGSSPPWPGCCGR